MVVILPDNVRNYMSKFLSDDWMIDFGFMDESETIARCVALTRALLLPSQACCSPLAL